MKARQGIQPDGETAFQPAQAELEDTQLTRAAWINGAAHGVAGLEDELAQFMTPQGGDRHRQQQALQPLGVLQAGMVNVKAARLVIAEGLLNGLITNDKFCMSRERRLKLTWSRRPMRLRKAGMDGRAYPPDDDDRVHRGGIDETSVASSPASDGAARCAKAVGSSLPIPTAMGESKPEGRGIDPYDSRSTQAGGIR